MEEKNWSKEKEELFNRWTKYNPKKEKEVVGFQQSMENVLDFVLVELDKAREEGRKEYARELLDDYYDAEGDSITIDISEIQNELSKLKDNK